MLLKCDLVVINRQAPGMENRKCHSTLVLGRQKKKGSLVEFEVFFTLFSVKN